VFRSLLVAGLVSLTAGPAIAHDVPPRRSIVRPVGGDRFTFVMLVPLPAHLWGDELKVRWKYPRSGLYENDPAGRPKLKWAVGWYSEIVLPAADGVHLARVHTLGAMLPGKSRDEQLTEMRKVDVLSLYANGKLVKAFPVCDLFDVSAFTVDPPTTWFSWGNEAKLDDAAGTVTVRAATGEWATVSLRTREVVDRGRESDSLADAGTDRDRQPWWAVLAAGVAVVGVGGAVLLLTAALLVRRVEPRLAKSLSRSQAEPGSTNYT
jgi:hypothetical protein